LHAGPGLAHAGDGGPIVAGLLGLRQQPDSLGAQRLELREQIVCLGDGLRGRACASPAGTWSALWRWTAPTDIANRIAMCRYGSPATSAASIAARWGWVQTVQVRGISAWP